MQWTFADLSIRLTIVFPLVNNMPYPCPCLPKAGCSFRNLVAGEDDQIERLLSVYTLLGPVLGPYRRCGQPVSWYHPRRYALPGVVDRASRVVGRFRADHNRSAAHVFGEVDPCAAAPGTSRGVLVRMDVVARQVHRCCRGTRIHAQKRPT